MRPSVVAGMVAFSASAAWSRPAAAQAPGPGRLEVSGVIGRIATDGRDFAGVKAGLGGGAAIRVRLAGRLSLGAGYHYSDHGLPSLPEHFHVRVVYGEARYSGRLPGWPLLGFAGVRAGHTSETITVVGGTASGWMAGGLAGLQYPVRSHVMVELQVSESAIHFGDGRTSTGPQPGTAASGSAFGIEAGVAIRI